MKKNNKISTTCFSIKFIVANFIAIIVSSCLLLPYIGPCKHALPAKGVTTSRHISNGFYYQFKEGGFIGKFDKSGYNNKQQTTNNIDILLLGSSHFESLQVFPNENLGMLLNDKLEENNVPGTAYNLGISRQVFPFCVCHYETALQQYTPRKYAVVEFFTDILDPKKVQKALDGSLLDEDICREPSFAKRLFGKLRIVSHLQSTLKTRLGSQSEIEKVNDDILFLNLQKCFKVLAKSSEKHNIQCLLLFRPRFEINKDGSISSKSSPEYVQKLKTLSENEGLVFIDMTSRMIEEYDSKKILPYGFWNTFPNKGHCNKEGHRMMAEAIYDKIMELENSKEEESK